MRKDHDGARFDRRNETEGDNTANENIIDLFDDEAENAADDEAADDNDEDFDEEQFDLEDDEPAARRVSSREFAAMRTRKRKRLIMIIALCVAGALVLGVGGYFAVTLINENNQVERVSGLSTALADVNAFASLSDYSAAAAQARAEYNALPAKLRAKVDEQPILTAEETITRVSAIQDKLTALPTDIAYTELASQTALIASVRTEFDALSELDKHLLDESLLTAAEALSTAKAQEYAPIADINARIAAYTISDESTKANIDKVTAELAAFRTELAAATYDISYVDTAKLDTFEQQLSSLVSNYSTRLAADGPAILDKLKEAAGYNSKIVNLINSVTIMEGSMEPVSFQLSDISSYADKYVSAMESALSMIKGADMFNIVTGYKDGALSAAQRGIDKAKAGVKYGKNTTITTTAQQSEFLSYFTSASKATSEVSIAVTTVNSGIKTYIESLNTANPTPTPSASPAPSATPAA